MNWMKWQQPQENEDILSQFIAPAFQTCTVNQNLY
jgi:hypothetical protein